MRSHDPPLLRLAVLDMIGTTVDADDAVSAAFEAAFAGRGVALTDDEIAAVRGRSKRDAVAGLVAARLPPGPEGASLVDEIHTSFVAGLRSRLVHGARPVVGTPALFDWLAGRGVAVVLTTGLDRETARRVVERVGWQKAPIRAVLTGDDVEHGRPSPDLIHLAMRRTGVAEPRVVLNVGDTVSDLVSARAAGVGWSIGVLTGAHTPDQLGTEPHSALLAGVADLPRWLTEVGALHRGEPGAFP